MLNLAVMSLNTTRAYTTAETTNTTESYESGTTGRQYSTVKHLQVTPKVNPSTVGKESTEQLSLRTNSSTNMQSSSDSFADYSALYAHGTPKASATELSNDNQTQSDLYPNQISVTSSVFLHNSTKSTNIANSTRLEISRGLANTTYLSSTTTPFPGYINLQNISFDWDYPFGPADPNLGGGSRNFSSCVGDVFDQGSSNVTAIAPLCMAATTNYSNLTDAARNEPSAEVRYWALLLLCFPLLTVFGNCLVVLAVHRERSLRTVTNYFIVSLAVADIVIGIVVMPLAVYVEVSQN